MIYICRSCQREVDKLPEAIREDLSDALARLEAGHVLCMPLSRPMPSVGRSVHELRLRDQSGVYRVMYVIVEPGVIYILHVFKKTTQQTSFYDIRVAKKRLREVLK